MGKDNRSTTDVTPTLGGSTELEQLRAQREYVESLEKAGDDFGLMVAGAFIRGIRDIGYKHTGTALDEIIDNVFQALASQVHVVFGYSGRSDKKPDALAVVDDGHGMEPGMLRAAIRWGGTHRENDRSGWGRYGYGMKSAAVSQGKRFTVYSKVAGGALHKIELDLQAVEDGDDTDENGRIVAPMPEAADLPTWVADYMEQQLGTREFDHGTVVVIDKLDRLSYKTTERLKILFFDHFGVTYRNTLREQALFVDGKQVEPIDPLFSTPGMWLHDLDEDRAEAYEPDLIEVKDRDTGKAAGADPGVNLDMPPTFQSENKKRGGKPLNARFNIMKEHKGIAVLRNGRQIDVVDTKCPWTTFQVYDRNWGLEVDFPATLDEEFSITIFQAAGRPLGAYVADPLAQAGVKQMITTLRARFKEDKAQVKAEQDAPENTKRPSEEAMEDAAPFKRKPQPSADQEKKSKERLQEEVRRRVKEGGMPRPKSGASSSWPRGRTRWSWNPRPAGCSSAWRSWGGSWCCTSTLPTGSTRTSTPAPALTRGCDPVSRCCSSPLARPRSSPRVAAASSTRRSGRCGP